MPDAPVRVSLAAIAAFPAAITVSGSLTDGTDPVTFPLMPYDGMVNGKPRYAASVGEVDYYLQWQDDEWRLEAGVSGGQWYSVSDVADPTQAADWTAAQTGTGTPGIAAALADPVKITLEGTAAAVAASMTTASGTANSNLVFIARTPGQVGNLITVGAFVTGIDRTLSVDVNGRDIIINVATNGSAIPTSTATAIKAALEASPAASALITVALAPANSGAGVFTPFAAASLTGGSGGPGLPSRVEI